MLSGSLQPGDRLPSYPEMKARGIGQNTVDRVHSLLELEGLIERRNGRGVFVAQPKPKVSTGIIGFSHGVHDEVETSFYWSQLVSGIRSSTSGAGRRLLLLQEEETHDPGVWDNLDGVVLGSNLRSVRKTIQSLPAGLPFSVALSEVENVNHVLADEFAGGRIATGHLLSLGHRHIGCLFTHDCPVGDRRLRGYLSALAESGIMPGAAWIRRFKNGPGNDGATIFQESGFREMRAWYREGWKSEGLTALVAQNDHVAVGAIQALRELGLSVPEDVSVVGFDGTAFYRYFTPNLTTVHVPLHEIGARAASQVLRQWQSGECAPVQELVPVALRAGASTGRLLW